MCQNLRSIGAEDKEIGLVDVDRYIRHSGINLPLSEDGREKKILTGEEELGNLIGLDSVKRMIKKSRHMLNARNNKS